MHGHGTRMDGDGGGEENIYTRTEAMDRTQLTPSSRHFLAPSRMLRSNADEKVCVCVDAHQCTRIHTSLTCSMDSNTYQIRGKG